MRSRTTKGSIGSLPRVFTPASFGWSLRKAICAGLFVSTAALAQPPVHHFWDDYSYLQQQRTPMSIQEKTVDQGPNISDTCSPGTLQETIQYTDVVPIATVVGQGVSGVDVDQNGKLLNPSALKANGVVSETVEVRLHLGSVFSVPNVCTTHPPPTIEYDMTLNGTWTEHFSRNLYRPFDAVFKVPADAFRFGTRNVGGIPIPGMNQFVVAANVAQIQAAWNAYESSAYGQVPKIDVKFSAMAPIVLVHGIQTGPWWWGPHPSTADPCGPKPGHGEFDGGFNFVQTLQLAGAPFVCKTVRISPGDPGNASIENGRDQLKSLLTQITNEFGTNHVHLVGHSKGGFWIRAALPSLAVGLNIGVYSATTISTPHHGSVLADFQVLAHRDDVVVSFNLSSDIQLIVAATRRMGADVLDLRTSVAESVNRQIGPPPLEYVVEDVDSGDDVTDQPTYFGMGADADVNGNGRIDAAANPGDEGYPSPPYFFLLRGFKTATANARYQFLRNVGLVSLRVGVRGLEIQTVPDVQPHKNDLSVTTESAKFTGFTPILNGTNDYFPYNHTGLGRPEIATQVLQGIRQAQPMKQ
jgi:hypothetical protein